MDRNIPRKNIQIQQMDQWVINIRPYALYGLMRRYLRHSLAQHLNSFLEKCCGCRGKEFMKTYLSICAHYHRPTVAPPSFRNKISELVSPHINFPLLNRFNALPQEPFAERPFVSYAKCVRPIQIISTGLRRQLNVDAGRSLKTIEYTMKVFYFE